MTGHGPALISSRPFVRMEGGVALEVSSSLGKERIGQKGELMTKCEGNSGLRREVCTRGSPELWVFLLAGADFARAG